MKAIRATSPKTEPTESNSQEWKGILATGSSLPCKLIVFVVVLVLGATGTVAGYLLRSSISLARESEHRQVSDVGRALARAASHAFREPDPASLQELSRKSANGQPLIYAVFYDRNFREIAASDFAGGEMIEELRRERGLGDNPRGIPQPRQFSNRRDFILDVMYPVTILGGLDKVSRDPTVDGLQGYVRVGMIAGTWYRALNSRLDVLVGVGILIAVIAIPLGYLLVRRIVMPLESLNEAMIQFSQGRWDVRSPVVRNDEIGRLTRTFNRMTDLHQEMHERIVKLNNQLEERVAMRTRQLRELAARDPLTGLYNRRHLNEFLEQQLSEAQRYGSELACVMIDLDGFKQVNDRFGHHTGDEVLLIAASTITGELRASDVAARYGGDEFVLVLPHTSSESARVMTERLSACFSAELAQRLPQIHTGMSCGIASLRVGEVADAETLLRAADRALYRAKASGAQVSGRRAEAAGIPAS